MKEKEKRLKVGQIATSLYNSKFVLLLCISPNLNISKGAQHFQQGKYSERLYNHGVYVYSFGKNVQLQQLLIPTAVSKALNKSSICLSACHH